MPAKRNCAFSTWLLRSVALDRALELMAGSGFDAVELSGTGSDLLTAWEKDCEGLTHAIEAMRIKVRSVHCTVLGRRWLGDADRTLRQKSIDENIRYLERMHACGIPELVLHPYGGGATRTETFGQRISRVRDSLRQLADHAAARGVRIALENGETEGDPMSTMHGLLDLIGDESHPIGLCHDVGHSALAGLDLLEEAHTACAAGRLFSLHLHDVTPERESHIIPGDGALPLKRLIEMLDASGFDGLYTLEVKPSAMDTAACLSRMARVRADMML